MRIDNLVALCIALSALGATTRPTTAPSSAPAVDPATAYRKAVTLIKQGKPAEALPQLQQADRSYGRVTKIDSQRADIVYASAICSMLQGEYPKAHQAMERIRSSRPLDRGFILNDSKADLAVK